MPWIITLARRNILKVTAILLIILNLTIGLSACSSPPAGGDGLTLDDVITPCDCCSDEHTHPPDTNSGNGTEDTTPPAEPEPEPIITQTPDILMPFNEDITAFELAGNMKAGWNLGNTLDARLAVAATPIVSSQETAWGNPITSREMIQLLADTGFSSLRIPVTWERFIGPAPNYFLNTALLDRVQQLVDYAYEAGLYVIINTHHETWNFPSSDNTEAVIIHDRLWRQIADRFAGYDERLIFESMNEPRPFGTGQEWTGGTEESRSVINSWNHNFIRTIRDTGYNNEKRFLLIPTIAASGDSVAIDNMWVPRDQRVLISIHAYTPYDLVLNTRNARNTFDPNEPNDTGPIDALFNRLYERFISQGTAVVMGEMGFLNKEDNIEARSAWTDYYTEKAAAIGIPCFWWDNGIRAAGGNTESFGIMNRLEKDWWFPEIVEALLKHYN
jgi:endoglucanase